jgi:hypothetical protein
VTPAPPPQKKGDKAGLFSDIAGGATWSTGILKSSGVYRHLPLPHDQREGSVWCTWHYAVANTLQQLSPVHCPWYRIESESLCVPVKSLIDYGRARACACTHTHTHTHARARGKRGITRKTVEQNSSGAALLKTVSMQYDQCAGMRKDLASAPSLSQQS